MALAIYRAKIIIENDLSHVMKNGRVALSAKKWGGVFWVMAVLIT